MEELFSYLMKVIYTYTNLNNLKNKEENLKAYHLILAVVTH